MSRLDKRLVRGVGGVAIGLLLAGCATVVAPPEMKRAEVALKEAKDANADTRVPQQYELALGHFQAAQRAFTNDQDTVAAAHLARLAEARARDAQARSGALAAAETLQAQSERRRLAQLDVRDAEVILLQVQARTEAEKRAAEQARQALTERRRLEEELARREATLLEMEKARMEGRAVAEALTKEREAERRRLEGEIAERERVAGEAQASGQRLRAEIEQMKKDLAALQAQGAAERTRLEEQQKALQEQRRAYAEQEKALQEQRRMAEEQQKALQEQQRIAAEREKALQEQRQVAEARAAEIARLKEDQQRTLAKLAEIREEPRGLVITLPGNIFFDTNRAEVRPVMQDRLTEIARALTAIPGQALRVEGHTDSDGTGEYNLRLSELRAQSVKALLVKGGLPADVIQTVGFGETRPRASNATSSGKAQNRRVEIVVSALPTTGSN